MSRGKEDRSFVRDPRPLHKGPAPFSALTRHFFEPHFDLGFLSDAGADGFRRVVAGVLAAPVAFGLLLARAYILKYLALSSQSTPEPYLAALIADGTFIIALPMVLLAFVTLLISRSVFPSETDYRVLMALPVARRTIFGAKITALALFLGLFIAASNVSIGPLFVLVSHGRWSEHPLLARLVAHTVASGAASVFAAAIVVALVGLLTVCVPRARAQLAVGLLQTGLLCGLVLALPLIFRLPGHARSFEAEPWQLYILPFTAFLGIERVLLGETTPLFVGLAQIGGLALLATGLTVAVCYTVCYRRFERILFRPQPRTAHRVSSQPRRRRFAWRGQPARTAVAHFTALTLRRSTLHRGVFMGVTACGVGLVGIHLTGTGLAGWLQTGGEPAHRLQVALAYAPFVLMFAMVMALRAAFLLPLEQRASWIFQITELDATRPQQLASVERTFLSMGIVVPVLALLPLHWMWLGATAIVSLIVATLYGFGLVELVLTDWRRLPFTCTYVPGKRFVAHTVVIAVSIFVLFVNLGAALLASSLADRRLAVAVVGVLLIVVGTLRWHRLRTWGKIPLSFEDELPDAPQTIRLATD